MKKIVSGILLLVMLISLCGCNSSKYEKAVTYLNCGDYESALSLFEELAEKDYKDSAEKVKETKYQFVSNKKDEEDLTVYEYLTELVEENYKDSKEIYDKLYTWKFDIAFSTSKKSMSHNDTVKASTLLLPFYYINFRITGGKPGETLHGTYVIKYSNGQESSDGFFDGKGSVLSLLCSATQSPLGKTTFSLYDDYGNLLANKSAIIK